jgi:ABC-type lipoprotein release transport system permease subunit
MAWGWQPTRGWCLPISKLVTVYRKSGSRCHLFLALPATEYRPGDVRRRSHAGAAVALLAGLLPARRAARVDPGALRLS